jgi:ElaB/YqjD/DUF883 family membrane-anchored ribosome-binding protein
MEVYFENMTAEEGTTEKLTHDLRALVHDVKHVVAASGGKICEEAVASAKATDKLVRQFPYPSLGIAFGVGIALGLWVTRK